jgi:hypothetical protein
MISLHIATVLVFSQLRLPLLHLLSSKRGSNEVSTSIFSDLAVHDITDEVAAVPSGGVGFSWANNLDGTSSSSPLYLPDNFNEVVNIKFNGVDAPMSFNNNIESFRINQAVSGRKYLVGFYDGNDNQSGYMGQLTLTSANNDKWLPLSTSIRNKTSSLGIIRVA